MRMFAVNRLHGQITELALSYHTPMITVDCDKESGTRIFGPDLQHLTQEGHEHVHQQLMEV